MSYFQSHEKIENEKPFSIDDALHAFESKPNQTRDISSDIELSHLYLLHYLHAPDLDVNDSVEHISNRFKRHFIVDKNNCKISFMIVTISSNFELSIFKRNAMIKFTCVFGVDTVQHCNTCLHLTYLLNTVSTRLAKVAYDQCINDDDKHSCILIQRSKRL